MNAQFLMHNMVMRHNMIEYKVEVDDFDTIRWINTEGKYHGEHGSAVICADGSQEYYLNGERLSKEQFDAQNKD